MGHHVVPLLGRRASATGRAAARGGDRPRLPSRLGRLPVRGTGVDRRSAGAGDPPAAHRAAAARGRRRGRSPSSSRRRRTRRSPDTGRRRSARSSRPASSRCTACGRRRSAIRDDDVFGLLLDVEVLLGLARALPADEARRIRVLRQLEAAFDVLDLDHVAATAAAARRTAAAGARPRRRDPARTTSSPSATRTSTRRGCGRSARRCASAPARSPRPSG